ncbi:MAG: 4,5-DOPA dioxygenase extradiol [Gammaproteobacteria bacterium]|nr:4,5-DOPA dioxygenase extradiol [Gammaproteobacteria bacterium]MDH3507074.1 4,5-DOPA dioxygenase extradiol [Gammaproteobacteria bacterium]
MPVVFVGHGSPMNLIEDNQWSRGFRGLGQRLPRPAAILAVSAHWFVDGTFVTGGDSPRTIHDFSGFPQALYEIEYPAPGDPDLAERARLLVGGDRAALSADWGLDHGTWSVLRWMYPEADIPVVQLSIDRRLEPAGHLELGRRITSLREESVLILASGNLTHNLPDAFRRMREGATETPGWAARFDDAAAEAITGRDTAGLLALWPDSLDGRRAHPTPDHWLPVLYAYGASRPDDRVDFPAAGFDLGSLSMRSVVFG